jgi:hypothetical protein
LHAAKQGDSQDKLIRIEWQILRDLKRTLRKKELSIEEKTRVANAIAYHASLLNKLMKQKGEETQFEDATLGDFIRDVTPSVRCMIRRDYRTWMRRLSSER